MNAISVLNVVVEIPLAAHSSPNTEDMSGDKLWVEFNVVPGFLPEITGVAQEVMHLVRLLRINIQVIKRELYPAGLSVMRIEVHNHQNNV